RPNPGLANAVKLKDGPLIDKIVIKNFSFAQGDLSVTGSRGLPPVVPQGHSLTFVNREPGGGLKIFHTITGCAAPCNKTAGVSFPIPNGAPFDSGELGYGP